MEGPGGRRERPGPRRVLELDSAFRQGDIHALRAAAGTEWGVPNGPMPREIGNCLEYAIYWSPITLIADLLDAGADPCPADHSGFPPLVAAIHECTRPDAHEVVGLLLRPGADPNERGLNDYGPLHFAVLQRRHDTAQLLLDHGADPGLATRIDDLETALDLARKAGDDRMQALLES